MGLPVQYVCLPGILAARGALHRIAAHVGEESHHALRVIGGVEAAHRVHRQLIQRVEGPLVQRQLIRQRIRCQTGSADH
jgi:hypothetical protein